MMHGTVPKSMKEENVVFIVAFARNDFTQCRRNGKRIIKHTIRIDVTTELGIHQPLPHLGRKTRTHQQQIILLRKKGHTGNYFYRRIKIHKLGIKKHSHSGKRMYQPTCYATKIVNFNIKKAGDITSHYIICLK